MITNARYQPNRYYRADSDRSLVTSLAITALASTLLIVAYLIYAAYMGYSEHQKISADLADSAPIQVQSSDARTPTFINTHFTRQ